MSSLIFFFKQKTAYEMRISDWSSDVCSSDLPAECALALVAHQRVAKQYADVVRFNAFGRYHARDERRDGRGLFVGVGGGKRLDIGAVDQRGLNFITLIITIGRGMDGCGIPAIRVENHRLARDRDRCGTGVDIVILIEKPIEQSNSGNRKQK